MSTFFASIPHRGRWALPLLVSALCLQSGCKKKQNKETQHPDPVSDAATPGEDTAAKEPSEPGEQEAEIVQIPDPASIQEAANYYWKGNYEELVAKLEQELGGWDAPNQKRAAGLAHGWIALAHAEQLPENAQTHVDQARELNQDLQDADVEALAQIAAALSLVAMSDAQQAQEQLLALSDPQDDQLARLTHIAKAKTAINLAFDERERLAHPEKLDDAERSYRLVRPNKDPQENSVMGHVHEGMAAIAKFKGKIKIMCEQAQKAKQAYQDGGASDLLQSGPSRMMEAGRCK